MYLGIFVNDFEVPKIDRYYKKRKFQMSWQLKKRAFGFFIRYVLYFHDKTLLKSLKHHYSIVN